MKQPYSDEIINAFVDDELDGPEREKFKSAMSQDPELEQKVHSVCELKRTIKNAYQDIPVATSDSHRAALCRYLGWQHAVAAVLMLCIGAFVGWQSHDEYQALQHYAAHESDAYDTLHGLKLTPVSLQKSNKIVLHISSGDSEKLKKAINQVEHILSQYKNNSLSFDLEVLANSTGLDMLRVDVSPYRNKIESIMASHENVSFIACSNALQRLREKGIEPRLIADTKTDVTAVEQIIKRLQQGWVYVKV